jgi:hypothetical protein
MSSIEKLRNVNLRLRQLIDANRSEPLVAEDGWPALVKYFSDLQQSQDVSENQITIFSRRITELETELAISRSFGSASDQKILDSKDAELSELYQLATESINHSNEFAKLLESTSKEMKTCSVSQQEFEELEKIISEAKNKILI